MPVLGSDQRLRGSSYQSVGIINIAREPQLICWESPFWGWDICNKKQEDTQEVIRKVVRSYECLTPLGILGWSVPLVIYSTQTTVACNFLLERTPETHRELGNKLLCHQGMTLSILTPIYRPIIAMENLRVYGNPDKRLYSKMEIHQWRSSNYLQNSDSSPDLGL